jgi:predicted Co/Zn/Cd cation transporter (cation efflux family)
VRPPLPHAVAALERTALAWERTAFSLAAVGALLLKVVDGGTVVRAAGAVLLAVAVAVVLVMVPVGYRRAVARVDPDDQAAPFADEDPWRRRAVLATAVVVALTVAAVGAELLVHEVAG